MAVDVSGSMGERDFISEDVPISRLEAVQKLFALFIAGGREGGEQFDGRPADLVGLVRFATRPEVVCPLTLQHRTLLTLLETEQPRTVPGESETNISDALALSLARLEAAGPRRKVLVLLTDGEHNVTSPRSEWTPRQAAQVAASLGVTVHCIDAGTDDIRPGESADTRQAAVRTLTEIASITRGEYLKAGDTRSLAAALRRIDSLERSPIASFQFRRYHEGYPWLALAAFACLVFGELLSRTLWRRLP
jgi:Ca-activated chloride channel family protein